MAEKEKITNPSMGSNELGSETEERVEGKGVSAGTDTQLRMAALDSQKEKEKKANKTNDQKDATVYPEAGDTDE